MDIFDVLTLVGGLCLFLFGMNIMGQALERRAGSKLRAILGKLTSGKFTGLLTGMGVTAVIQSSSATTVMVVGFVNSGLITLKQAIHVIMGANIGTTITAWILSLSGISSDNVFVQLLKPMSFTPVLALIGIIFYMFLKGSKSRDTGIILLGFATLMFGMNLMSDSVAGLRDVPAFTELFIMFKNPILGVIVGAILTGVIQSSSASVGILQSLCSTGAVSYGAAIPIIMGQNIGTCVTALLSSVGANKNAKRAAFVHLSFNIIGTVILLIVYTIVDATIHPLILDAAASEMGIAVAHSVFNIVCTAMLLPMSGLLEKLAIRLIPDSKLPESTTELDERLLATPSIALERCHAIASEMANMAVDTLKGGLKSMTEYTEELAEQIRRMEDRTDHDEDILGSYLVKLSSCRISDTDSAEAAQLLKIIGDFERISDHGVNVLESAEELRTKDLQLTPAADAELSTLMSAVSEILDLSLKAFLDHDLETAIKVEPLEEVIDVLKERLRTNHIHRLQRGECTIEAGFVWSDLLGYLERTSDHCSNIAGCVIEIASRHMNVHETLRALRIDNPVYTENYQKYLEKYAI